MIKLAGWFALSQKFENIKQQYNLAARLVQSGTNIGRFQYKFKPGSGNTDIENQSFSDKQILKLLNLFGDEDMQKNPLSVLTRDNEDRKTIRLMFFHFSEALKIVNKKPNLMPNDPQYKATLFRDACDMQNDFTDWGVYAMRIFGDKVITNYGFDCIAGNFRHCMLKHQIYLIYARNDAAEHINDDIMCVVHRHSQKFGAAGRGKRLTTKAEAVWRWALLKLGYALNLTDIVIKNHIEKLAARRLQAIAKLRTTHHDAAYISARKRKKKVTKRIAEKNHTAQLKKRLRNVSRHGQIPKFNPYVDYN